VRHLCRAHGKPGVWLLSLERDQSRAIMRVAEVFHLPYHHERISLTAPPASRCFHSEESSHEPARFAGKTYGPRATPRVVEPGTLRIFSAGALLRVRAGSRGAVVSSTGHHVAWPLTKRHGDT